MYAAIPRPHVPAEELAEELVNSKAPEKTRKGREGDSDGGLGAAAGI